MDGIDDRWAATPDGNWRPAASRNEGLTTALLDRIEREGSAAPRCNGR